MSEIISCAQPEALIAYVYDECEPAERQSIAAHLALCPACAEEIRGLQDTRAHLGAWTPPALSLDFQITSASAREAAGKPADVLRPAAFWKRPLPAWAQVAAAAVIFAAGLSVGALRGPAEAPRTVAVATPDPAPATPVAAAISADDVARLDARLRSVETAQTQQVAAIRRQPAQPAVNEAALLERVNALVDERLQQTQRQNLRLMTAFAQEMQHTRGAMEEELLQQRQEVRRALPIVRTALTNGGR